MAIIREQKRARTDAVVIIEKGSRRCLVQSVENWCKPRDCQGSFELERTHTHLSRRGNAMSEMVARLAHLSMSTLDLDDGSMLSCTFPRLTEATLKNLV